MRTIFLAAVGSLLACSGVADAALTLHTSAFITSPIAGSDFESLPVSGVPINSPFNIGGITIQYVDASGVFDGSTIGSADVGVGGSAGWYSPDYNGYTTIKLIDGTAFNQIQFAAASGGGATPFQYSLLLNGSEVANGQAGPLETDPVIQFRYLTFGFSGLSFDEVRLKQDISETTFIPVTDMDTLALDDIAIGRAVVDAVPEPATWAMMIAGFGLAGAALRRRGARFNGAVMDGAAA
jgi:hypothetical protein